MVTYHS